MFSYWFRKPSGFRLAAFGVTAAIAWFTLSPWTLSPQPLGFNQADKVWHFLAFFIWGVLVAVSCARPLWQLLVAGLLLGAGIEVIQPLVGRDAELADLVADMLGAGVGIRLGASLCSWIRSENNA